MSHKSARDDAPTLAEGSHAPAVLRATRDLLWIESPDDAKAAAIRLVASLGGDVVAADQADGGALPVDVSFGVGIPLLPAAAPASVARMLLERHLPGFVRDAHRAVELAARTTRLTQDAEHDALTGLANRRLVGRALARLRSGDVVILLDLDHFKRLNDTLGHEQGDEVLRAFGRTLNDTVRARDLAARYGGEEFVVVLPASDDPDDAEAFLRRLRRSWEAARPHAVTFSAGLARAGDDPAQAMPAADAAMYAAKQAGRDRWIWSQARPDGSPSAEGSAIPAADVPGAAFVAYSRLDVPADGSDDLVAAFRDRLGKVDGWPGFQRLEVWQDRADPSAFVMVSWWDSEAAFGRYMASSDHRQSHARIPTGDLRPRPDTFHRYELVAR